MWQLIALWVSMNDTTFKKALEKYFDTLVSCGHIQESETNSMLIVLYLNELIEDTSSFITEEQLSCLVRMRDKEIMSSCIMRTLQLLE